MQVTIFRRAARTSVLVGLALLGVLSHGLAPSAPAAAAPGECRTDPSGVPPPPPQADSRPARYFHTCGTQIVDPDGAPVLMTGVTWFGLETESMAPHGLWARNWRSLLDQITLMGFNTLRLPFSNEVLQPGQRPRSIDYQLNPDLEGKTSLEVLDAIVAGAAERGLKVVLTRHRPTAKGQTELWYTSEVPESRWVADWVMLAERYRGQDAVVAFDLHNEPHARATWGSGDQATDWRLAAERAGNAVLAANPYLLIFVQGIQREGDDWYWWGGNLRGVQRHPVRLAQAGRLVYAPHDFGPSVHKQSWFGASDFPRNLSRLWDDHWGYIHHEGLAPIVLGEWGGRSVGNDVEGIWHRELLEYLKRNGVGWIAWGINPNSDDVGGLLNNDWTTVLEQKVVLYGGYMAPPLDTGASGHFGPPSGRAMVHLRNSAVADLAEATIFNLRIANDGPEPLDLAGAEVRYWFSPDGVDPAEYVASLDYAVTGSGTVEASVEAAPDGAYVAVRFAPTAGVLAPYAITGEVVVRLRRADWSPLGQGDDYSFRGQGPMAPWERVALYREGTRVWGAEPERQVTPEPGEVSHGVPTE